MNVTTERSRDTLVAELLAPVPADANDGTSLLMRRLDVAREILLQDLAEKMQRGPLLDSPEAICEWLRLYFLNAERESFLVLFLDTRYRLLGSQTMFEGTVDHAEVHPREIARECLRRNCIAVVIAHNHPLGEAKPSHADRALTAQLRKALALIDVRLLDHFVVAGDQVLSFAQTGLL